MDGTGSNRSLRSSLTKLPRVHPTEAAERGLDELTIALLAFCDRYDIDYRDRRDARMKIRCGELETEADPARAFLAQRAFALWMAAK